MTSGPASLMWDSLWYYRPW